MVVSTFQLLGYPPSVRGFPLQCMSSTGIQSPRIFCKSVEHAEDRLLLRKQTTIFRGHRSHDRIVSDRATGRTNWRRAELSNMKQMKQIVLLGLIGVVAHVSFAADSKEKVTNAAKQL